MLREAQRYASTCWLATPLPVSWSASTPVSRLPAACLTRSRAPAMRTWIVVLRAPALSTTVARATTALVVG